MNAGTITVLLGANTSGLATAERRFKTFESQVRTSVRSMNTSLASLGRSFTYLAAPLAIASGAATKFYSDIEFSLAKIEGLVGISREQTRQWGNEMNQMTSTGQNIRTLGDAMYFVTSAGLRGSAAMDVLKISAQASAAGMGETKVIADLLTSAINAYGKGNLTAADAMDTLVAGVREGKVEAIDYVKSLGKVFPVASSMKVEFNEVAAAVAAMTRTGTPAATAGIQLRQILFALAKPAEQSKKALGDMAETYDNLRATIADEGLLQGLIKIKELTEQFGIEKMARIFPRVQAFVGTLDLLGENLKSNKKIFEAMLEPMGSFDHLIEAASNTFKYKWQVAMARGTNAMVGFGQTMIDSLIPVIDNIVGKVEQFVRWWRDLDTQVRANYISIGILVTKIGLLSMGLSIALGAIRSFGLLLTNTITVTVLAGAAFYYFVKNIEAWEKVAQRMNNAGDLKHFLKVKQEVDDARGAFQRYVLAAKDYIRNNQPGEQTVFKNVSRKYFDTLNEVKNLESQISTEADAATKEQLGKTLTSKIEALYKLREQLLVLGNNLVTGKVLALTPDFSIDKFKSKEEELVKGLINDVQNLDTNISGAGKEAVTSMLSDFKKDVKSVIEELNLGEAIPGLGDLFKVDQAQLAKERLDAMRASLLEIADSAESSFKPIDGFITTDLLKPAMFTEFRNELSKTQQYASQFGESFDSLGAQIQVYKKYLTDFENDKIIFTNPKELAFAQQMYAELQNLIQLQEDAKQKTFDWSRVAENAFQGMNNAIENALSNTQDILSAFGKFFGDFIKGLIIKMAAAAITALALTFVLSALGIPVGKTTGGVEMFKSLFGTLTGAKMGKGLAKGAIIPPGYNNDTFHAQLSTNEAVIPLERLPSIVSSLSPIARRSQKTEHRFVIEGRDLVVLMDEMDLLNNAY